MGKSLSQLSVPGTLRGKFMTCSIDDSEPHLKAVHTSCSNPVFSSVSGSFPRGGLVAIV